MYINDRKTDAHGGVVIAVRSEFEFVNVKSSSTIELTSGAVKLSKNKKKCCCFILQTTEYGE